VRFPVRACCPLARRAGEGQRVVNITGATRVFAIIGDPIAQVRSPEVFTEQFASRGIDAVMVPAHVPTNRFDAIVPALMQLGNLDGLLVTVPFKARMVRFATRLGKTARIIDAVNALRREADGTWTADMCTAPSARGIACADAA